MPLPREASRRRVDKCATHSAKNEANFIELDGNWLTDYNDVISEDSCDSSAQGSASSSSSSSPEHLCATDHDVTEVPDESDLSQIGLVANAQPENVENNNDVTHETKWFKFKRKYKPILYPFLKKLKIHLIMFFKCAISTFLILTTVQLG